MCKPVITYRDNVGSAGILGGARSVRLRQPVGVRSRGPTDTSTSHVQLDCLSGIAHQRADPPRAPAEPLTSSLLTLTLRVVRALCNY